MERIRVCNLRCLVDTSMIELKPITLLVGANSSGKSSFLRVFPLLRQSAEMRTVSGLLLNEGDVNFGFFNEAIHRDAEPSELKLEFELTLKRGLYQGGYLNHFLIGQIDASCELTYARRGKDQRYPYLNSVRLKLGNGPDSDVIELCSDEDGKITKFGVNTYVANGEVAQLRLRVGRGLVPALVRALDNKGGDDSLISDEVSETGLFEQKLLAETASLFHGRTTNETRLATLRSVGIGTPQGMLAAMRNITGVSSWHQRVQHWTLETSTFRNVRNLLLAKATGELLASVNLYVSQLARSVHYYKPVRASVERDYLSRDVQVSSVDSSGVNVAMVLASLGHTALGKFREWMRTHFGFEVFPQSVSDGARVALRMKEGGSGAEFNLADMGFGFSQMLPFLVQIWNLVEYEPTRRRPPFARQYQPSEWAMPRSFLIAIEQPELHLHPALQARLADLFVEVARLSRERNIPVRFMLETHSPTIIERVGHLLEAQRLKPEDVQVLLFERGGEGQQPNTGTVRSSHYDSEGILHDWPFGFLSPPPDPLPAFVVPASPAASSL